jgi:hypothetical protein
MLYTAQVSLDADDLVAGIAEVRRWLDSRGLDPTTFHYRMGSTAVALRIEFNSMADASAFADAFDGLVPGAKDKDMAQAAD